MLTQYYRRKHSSTLTSIRDWLHLSFVAGTKNEGLGTDIRNRYISYYLRQHPTTDYKGTSPRRAVVRHARKGWEYCRQIKSGNETSRPRGASRKFHGSVRLSGGREAGNTPCTQRRARISIGTRYLTSIRSWAERCRHHDTISKQQQQQQALQPNVFAVTIVAVA